MKRFVAVLMAGVLALGLGACATAKATNDVPEAGSAAEAAQAAQESELEAEPEQAVAIEEDGDAIFDNGFDEVNYGPMDLCRDNPFKDFEITSVTLRLHGVGEQELSGGYEATILGIVQNEAREWQDQPDFPNGTYFITDYLPFSFVVTLETGEEFVVRAHTAQGTPSNILSIGDEDYALTAEEYTAFNEVHEIVRDEIIAAAGDTEKPYADLTKDDLAHIERVRHYTEADQSEQLLTVSQAEAVIEVLNKLELEPATANFDPEPLMGGGYEYFVLWFKDGSSVSVGAYQYYSEYDDNYELIDTYPVAYIDGAVYRCNAEYAEDMYWNYEESSEEYVQQYLYGRNVAEYPFEGLTADEVIDIHVGVDSVSGGSQTDAIVPLSIADEVVEVLRQLRVSDDNRVERQGFSFVESINRSSQLTIGLSSTDRVSLGVADGHVVLNQADYEEDPEVIDALQDLIDLANEKAKELLDANGDTQTVKASSSNTMNIVTAPGESQVSVKTYSFELSQKLVKHEDGYYGQGYTFETAPIAVLVNSYDGEMVDDLYSIKFSVPDDAISKRVKAEMEAANGEGYTDSPYASLAGASIELIDHVDEKTGVRERLMATSGGMDGFCVEVYIVERGDSDLTLDSVWALLYTTFNSSYEAVG